MASSTLKLFKGEEKGGEILQYGVFESSITYFRGRRSITSDKREYKMHS